jgi:hypothetical protein
VLIATVGGQTNKRELKALEELLGPGSVPSTPNVQKIEEDLAHRIARVNELVPPLRRAQVIRDLCIIVRADGHADEAELQRLERIAHAIGVDPSLAACAVSLPVNDLRA